MQDMTLEEAIHFFTIHQTTIGFRKMDGMKFDPHVIIRLGFDWFRYPDLITAAKETHKRYYNKDWVRGEICSEEYWYNQN